MLRYSYVLAVGLYDFDYTAGQIARLDVNWRLQFRGDRPAMRRQICAIYGARI